jgi:hypothetical protein
MRQPESDELSQQTFHDFARDIGQPEIPSRVSIRQPLVIEAE